MTGELIACCTYSYIHRVTRVYAQYNTCIYVYESWLIVNGSVRIYSIKEEIIPVNGYGQSWINGYPESRNTPPPSLSLS